MKKFEIGLKMNDSIKVDESLLEASDFSVLEKAVKSDNYVVRAEVAKNPNIFSIPKIIEILLEDKDSFVLRSLASNINITSIVLEKLFLHDDKDIKLAVINSKKVPLIILEKALGENDKLIIEDTLKQLIYFYSEAKKFKNEFIIEEIKKIINNFQRDFEKRNFGPEVDFYLKSLKEKFN